jgi:hypothetical protein
MPITSTAIDAKRGWRQSGQKTLRESWIAIEITLIICPRRPEIPCPRARKAAAGGIDIYRAFNDLRHWS